MQKGNYSLGSATAKETSRLGAAWVGNGGRLASDGRTLVSKDGLRVFRPASQKADGSIQANFERRIRNKDESWSVIGNGHMKLSRMFAELKDISFVDAIFDDVGRFESVKPINVPMHATIGVKGSEGGDLFVFKACNSTWLISKIDKHPLLVSKTVLCDGKTLQEIKMYLHAEVSGIHGYRWTDIVLKIEAIADWEFAK